MATRFPDPAPPVAVIMADLFENPLGTDGFEFVEYTSPEPEKLDKLFTLLGFTAVAKHKTRNILRYKQGDITFLVNREKTGQAADFRAEHGRDVSALRVRRQVRIVIPSARELRNAAQAGMKPRMADAQVTMPISARS